MFEIGFWAHSKFLDVMIEITDVKDRSAHYTRVSAVWWNRGQGDGPYIIDPEPREIDIYVQQYCYWSQVDYHPITQ